MRLGSLKTWILAHEELAGGRGQDRGGGHGAERDARVGDGLAVHLQPGGDAHNGQVHGLAGGKLDVGRALVPAQGRDDDVRRDLVVGKAGLLHARKEVLGRDGAVFVMALDEDFCILRDQDRAAVAGRHRRADVAHQGALVAHLGGGDVLGGLGHGGVLFFHECGGLDVEELDEAADLQALFLVVLDLVETGDVLEVDDVLAVGKGALLHRREGVAAARDDHGVLAQLVKQVRCFLERFRREIVKIR